MLQRARQLARESGARVRFVKTDFAGLTRHFHGEFDAVVSMGNSICNLDSYDEVVIALTSAKACCRDGGACIVGTKRFDQILQTRGRFHRHRVGHGSDGACCLLFEVWDFQDPLLIVTTHRFHQNQGEWRVRSARTREFMLTSRALERAALEAGFTSVEQIDHPYEAAYRLWV